MWFSPAMPEKLLAFFPKLARCHAVFLFEHPVKIVDVVKPTERGDLIHGIKLALEQVLGLLDAKAV